MADRPPLVAVLAAGLGTRFGGGKLDADLAGKPLGQWALDAAADARLAPGLLVTGPQPPAFALASGWQLLSNPHPEAGLGGSVALAAAAAMAERRDLLLLLADMPLVTPEFITRLAAQTGAAATRQADGSAGVPALLPLALLPKAAALEGARGAAQMLREIAGLVLLDPPAEMLHDVDRPQDLAAAATLLAGKAT